MAYFYYIEPVIVPVPGQHTLLTRSAFVPMVLVGRADDLPPAPLRLRSSRLEDGQNNSASYRKRFYMDCIERP